MMDYRIEINLEYRQIIRNEDVDYFIETLSYPIDLESLNPFVSRIQFPKSRAILIRTAKCTHKITIHIMRDVDLYSSFANFEIDLEKKFLKIEKQEGYISMRLENR